ncbi:phosphoadenosine phosphosulfate reductase [Palleronia sediminis]|uniref:Phosphoadenosine phosphosulfate reductase n=1 Tax=Palleronia sediminis TaxID=2547833 RepID=A0A4R6A945_9RHOB|nr:phosphoadenosine phosphosulfate reductase [Palleronia sediminis]TDL79457.1 phosphoadenosine phosphosulfate reductase [Palleronia sediminis]
MTDTQERTRPASTEDVIAALRHEAGSTGFHRTLDGEHTATLIRRGPMLMVSFEDTAASLARRGGLPVGLDLVDDKDWSLLHVTADDASWFRRDAIYDFFDEMTDEGVFDTFEQVLFYGVGMGGYAACAFSVASPAARVLAIEPQATLERDRTGWETRFRESRALEFRRRYGYAPDMVEGAERAFIVFDPHRQLDHVHASMFWGENVTHLKVPRLEGVTDDRLDLALEELDILHRVIAEVGSGTMRAQDFYGYYRNRRAHGPYLRTLLQATIDRGSPRLTALLCAKVLETQRAPLFRRQLRAAARRLATKGERPDWLAEVIDAAAD